MKKVFSILIIAVLLCTALTACGTNPTKALVGTWSTTINDEQGEMLLRADGTFETEDLFSVTRLLPPTAKDRRLGMSVHFPYNGLYFIIQTAGLVVCFWSKFLIVVDHIYCELSYIIYFSLLVIQFQGQW